jgi:hypothetical protein
MAEHHDPFDDEDMQIQEIESKHSELEDQLYELEKKVKAYQTTAMLAKERGDAETLSNTLVRLARVNSAVGGKSAYAAYVARNADRAARRLRSRTKLGFISDKHAIGKAEEMANIDKKVEKAFLVHSEVQLIADTFSDLSYRTDTFLKMSQSALSLIKQDINGGRP